MGLEKDFEYLCLYDDPDWASVKALIKSAFGSLPETGEDDVDDDIPFADEEDEAFADDWYDEEDE